MDDNETQALLDTYNRLLRVALDQYHSRMAQIEKSEGNLVDAHNTSVDFFMSIAEARERIGFTGYVDAAREHMLKLAREALPKAQFGKAGDRLAAIAVAYTQNFRPADAGPGRMIAATRYAARIESGDTDAQMSAEISRKVEPETNAPEMHDAIIKSIGRLKKKLSETDYYKFNEKTLHFEKARPDIDLFEGLPHKKGRPRKN